MTYNYASLPHYSYRGARAMVLLHERFMHDFMSTWREAKARNIRLPETEDPDYESLDHVLAHVLRAGRGYMTWICEKLDLPDPGIETAPLADTAAEEAESYLEYLLEKWKTPLAGITEQQSELVFKSRWGTDYSIDAMLEHAVMHPIRHTFQLQELIATQS